MKDAIMGIALGMIFIGIILIGISLGSRVSFPESTEPRTAEQIQVDSIYFYLEEIHKNVQIATQQLRVLCLDLTDNDVEFCTVGEGNE